MYSESKIWIGNGQNGNHVCILPNMANRHGLIAGATGTGKTVTLKVLAEAFSDMGVPVFLADVKGDIAGMIAPGTDSEAMQERIQKFGLEGTGFSWQSYPAVIWDLFGKNGIQLRTTISEIGPLLLARILRLNDLQTDILNIVFKIADDNRLLLIDTKDLKSMLHYVDEHSQEFAADYGKISSASIGAIMRALVALELDGGDVFFGEPALAVTDLLSVGAGGKGVMNILDSSSLISNGRLYSTFLLWLLSELFETLPEVGDMAQPKMVFFFDEAHLLFEDASKTLLDKIGQVVRLIRSKGVGVYFCTQSPSDVPDDILAQLGNKIQHGLRAYTPAEQKAVRAAADSYRVNPEFDTYETIMALGTGEAIVSFLQEDGTPGIAERISVLPPQSRMGAITEAERDQSVKSSLLYSKYATAVDPDSAYEILMRMGQEAAAQAEKEKEEAAAAKEAQKQEEAAVKAAEKEALAAEKAAQKEALAAEKAAQKAAEKEAREAEKAAEKAAATKKKAVKAVGSTLVGTVGREVGKQLGKNFGSFGKTLGGNVGASIGRGLLNTLLKG